MHNLGQTTQPGALDVDGHIEDHALASIAHAAYVCTSDGTKQSFVSLSLKLKPAR
jgi:hypothetical protein